MLLLLVISNIFYEPSLNSLSIFGCVTHLYVLSSTPLMRVVANCLQQIVIIIINYSTDQPLNSTVLLLLYFTIFTLLCNNYVQFLLSLGLQFWYRRIFN